MRNRDGVPPGGEIQFSPHHLCCLAPIGPRIFLFP